MQGHVIVCGLQGIGLRAVEQFHLSGTQVVVIDDDTDPRLSRIGPYEELLRVLRARSDTRLASRHHGAP